MALKVINASLVEGKVVVTIEGKGPGEVATPDARTLAMKYAGTVGYPHVGYCGTSGSYPVDEKGEMWEDQNKMAMEQRIAAYRNDIQLMPRL